MIFGSSPKVEAFRNGLLGFKEPEGKGGAPYISVQEWMGLNSQKFKKGIKCIEREEIGKISRMERQRGNLERKHFEEKFSNKIVWKPSIQTDQKRTLHSNVFSKGELHHSGVVKELKDPSIWVDTSSHSSKWELSLVLNHLSLECFPFNC